MKLAKICKITALMTALCYYNICCYAESKKYWQ